MHLEVEAPNDLKAVRLTCRMLDQIAIPFLYSTLRATDREHFLHCVAISAVPTLASHVRKIQFLVPAAKPYIHRVEHVIDPKEESLTHFLHDFDLPFRHEEDFIDNLQIYWREGDEGDENDEAQQNKRRTMLHWESGPLSELLHFCLGPRMELSLAAFPKLQALETDTAIFLQGGFYLKIGAWLRRSLEYHLGGSFSFRTYSCRFTIAERIGASIVHLSLSRLCDVLDDGIDHPSLNVKHLNIDLSQETWRSKEHWKFYDDGRRSLLGPWLTHLSGLSTLTMIQNPTMDPFIDIVGELALPNSPNLHTVIFKNITTTPDKIQSFVNRHIGSLKALVIDRPRLVDCRAKKTWRSLRTKLQTKAWAFEELEMTDIYQDERACGDIYR